MQISADPTGAVFTTRKESDIVELSLGRSGLRVIVDTCRNEADDRVLVGYHFEAPRGFRYLDEGDLLRYWQSKAFANGHHLYKVSSGGWFDQERQLPGMVSTSDAVGTYREWFICTTNGCLNVLSAIEPLERVFDDF